MKNEPLQLRKAATNGPSDYFKHTLIVVLKMKSKIYFCLFTPLIASVYRISAFHHFLSFSSSISFPPTSQTKEPCPSVTSSCDFIREHNFILISSNS